MPLTVLQIAFPFAAVGPTAVGGAERVLGDLDAALIATGHQSLVVACEGSRPAGELFSAALPSVTVLDAASQLWCHKQFQNAIDRACASRRVDLIHMHGLDFHTYSLPPNVPVLVTLHLPIDWYPAEIWDRVGAEVQLQCVSQSQRNSSSQSRNFPVVENGVALPCLETPQKKQDYAVVLGRICPEKNVHAALEAGTQAATRVLLAGQVFPYRSHLQYFDEQVNPHLRNKGDGTRHVFLGPVSTPHRDRLLTRAKCLLHPTLAPETSSLVAMEAMAAGTPVIAYRSGALPEIVEDGVTGFLVDTMEEMAEAIRQVDRLSGEACRNHVARRFSKTRMVQQYFALYEELLHRPIRRYA